VSKSKQLVLSIRLDWAGEQAEGSVMEEITSRLYKIHILDYVM